MSFLFASQVREQAKSAAAKIRNDVKQERERQLLKLAKQVEVCFLTLPYFQVH